MSKLEVVYRRFFQFWLIFPEPKLSVALRRIYFQLMLTSHTSSEEEKILYLRKFAQNIANNNEGPQLLEDTAD